MPPHLSYQYRFHSAGQGLFASGTLTPKCQESQVPPFHWVFDCGSMSYKTTLAPLISHYRDLVVGDHLNLLCLSHFDSDHVNGLSDLLDGLHVGTVVMPYYTSLERLILGSKPRGSDEAYIAFLDNPIAFLTTRAASIGQIITIGGSNMDGDVDFPVESPNPPIDSDRPHPQKTWSFKPMKRERVTLQSEKDASGTTLITATDSFAALATDSNISAQWEFLFFHKPFDEKVRQSLVKKIDVILDASDPTERPQSLSDALKSPEIRANIKRAFTTTLKKVKGADINSTSLCVYTGPLLDSFERAEMLPPWPDPLMARAPAYAHRHHGHPESCSLLYTGDANLKPSENRKALRYFITKERWNHIAVLQVPHHGSIENWEVGATAEFPHRYSIFCADETRKRPGHPSREVVLDLLDHGPTLANKTLGWTITGSVYFHRFGNT